MGVLQIRGFKLPNLQLPPRLVANEKQLLQSNFFSHHEQQLFSRALASRQFWCAVIGLAVHDTCYSLITSHRIQCDLLFAWTPRKVRNSSTLLDNALIWQDRQVAERHIVRQNSSVGHSQVIYKFKGWRHARKSCHVTRWRIEKKAPGEISYAVIIIVELLINENTSQCLQGTLKWSTQN